MKVEQLPPDTKSKLEELLKGVEQELKSSRTQHTHAVSGSWTENVEAVLNGGTLRATEKPPIDYDKAKITKLHQALYRSDKGLFGVIVHAGRASAKGKWTFETKFISKAEYKELEAARKPLDAEIERELRRVTDKPKWEYASYGFNVRGKPPELFRRADGTLDKLEARPELKALLPKAQELYKKAGLDLVTVTWTLKPAGLEFSGYWE